LWVLGESFYAMFFQGLGDHTFLKLNLPQPFFSLRRAAQYFFIRALTSAFSAADIFRRRPCLMTFAGATASTFFAGRSRFAPPMPGNIRWIPETSASSSASLACAPTRASSFSPRRWRVVALVALQHLLQEAHGLSYAFAIEHGLTDVSPFVRHGVTVVRLNGQAEQPRERRLEGDEERRLLDAAGPHLRAVIETALETGCRRGEILALQWRQCRRAGITGLHLHDLRRESGSRLLEVPGVNVADVRDWLGHVNVTTTSKYLATTAFVCAQCSRRSRIRANLAHRSHMTATPSASLKRRPPLTDCCWGSYLVGTARFELATP
jgi:hypothetical protein